MFWSDGEYHELLLPIRLEAWSLTLLVFSSSRSWSIFNFVFVFVFVISKVHQDEWFKFLKFLRQFWNFVWLMRSEWLVRLLQWFDWVGNQSTFWFNFLFLKRRCTFCFQSFSAVDLRSLLKVDCVVSIPAPPPSSPPSLALFVTVKVAGIN